MSYRGIRQVGSGAWLIAILLLPQPLLSAVEMTKSGGAVDVRSKWVDPSALEHQDGYPLIEGRPDAGVLPAWRRLEQRALSDLKVFWSPATGTPEAIYGLMDDSASGLIDPEVTAREFLVRHAALLKMGSTADLQLIKLSQSPSGYHVLFQQTYRGIAVHGGLVGVHVSWSGLIYALVNSYVPNISLSSLTPEVSSRSAIENMLAELGAGAGHVSFIAEPRHQLMVEVSNTGDARLAWRITIPAREPLGTWETFWDAQTGERLTPLRDRNSYVDGIGRVFIPNAVVATGINELSDQNDDPAAVPEAAYTIVTLLGLDGTGYLNGSYVNTQLTSRRVFRSNNDFTDLNRADDGFEEVEIYWAIDTAQRYIQRLGLFSVADYSINVNANGISADNSFYIPNGDGRGRLVFGSGGVDDGEDADIIWHEYAHAIQESQLPDSNPNFDGMGEGFADYWAATMSTLMASADHASYDPAFGEWDATAYNPGDSEHPPFWRRVDTDAHYPEGRSRDPHITGLIWSGALWDIHQLLGRETADRIFLEGNFLLPINPSLPEAAAALLQADLTINGGANLEVLRAVFLARGLLDPGPQ